MELKLQNLVFPDKEEYTDYHTLFYKNATGLYDRKEKCLCFAGLSACDFTAYLNAFAMRKWRKHTKAGKIFLKLTVEGHFDLVLSGYHRIEKSAKRVPLFMKEYDLPEKTQIVVEVPENKETLVGFELRMFSECRIYGGGYYTEAAESDLNEVRLSIATTTFKKEDFIRKNVKMIKEELLAVDDIAGRNTYLHVVDNDNGRVLTREEMEGPHVFYHRSKNVGGSGGFTRGMIESIEQKPKATHVLLMDDDIVVLAESIRRTYMLLLLVKEKYKEYFISGAMLYYEQMDKFHEDVGFIGTDGGQYPSKTPGKIVSTAAMVMKEEAKTKKADSYAGWWYCCIPVSVIERNGFALPLFIRVDDTEFSLRNHAKFITMNGICVWHMGFVLKFNYFMEYYQVFRNFLIAEACNPSGRRRKIWNRFAGRGLFLTEILRFNYNAAELIVDAVNDYLKGPAFIEEEKCEERLKKMSARNAQMKDLEEFQDLGVDIDSIYTEDPRSLKDTILYKLTFNGHLFWPHRWLRKGPAAIAHDWFYNPQRQTLVDSVIAVNPYAYTGEIRSLDKKRFREVVRYYLQTVRKYKKMHKAVDRAYYNRRKYLTSYDFWKKYLELDKYRQEESQG